MVDLHIHSNFSDGSDSYMKILERAEELGLEYISITDHDNCKVYEEMENRNIEEIYTGKVIPGVEMQAYIQGFSIELLGYGVDYKMINESIETLSVPFKKRNMEELKRLYKRCIDIGVKFEGNVLENYDDNKDFYASEYLHKQMKKNMYNKQFIPDEESWERGSVFFKRHLTNVNSKFYVDETDLVLSVGKVIEIIKQAGGLVFVPHIYQYEENTFKILEELITKYDIDGIECYYSTFTKQQTQFLLKLCEKYNKYVSGGTDYHGLNRPGTNLGIGLGNLEIHNDVIENWVNKVDKRIKKQKILYNV